MHRSVSQKRAYQCQHIIEINRNHRIMISMIMISMIIHSHYEHVLPSPSHVSSSGWYPPATADADAAASCTAEGSRSATRFSSSSYWFKAARCAWPFCGGDDHCSWEENAAFRRLKSPMKLIFDQSQTKNHHFC